MKHECVMCGSELPVDAKVCSRCGKILHMSMTINFFEPSDEKKRNLFPPADLYISEKRVVIKSVSTSARMASMMGGLVGALVSVAIENTNKPANYCDAELREIVQVHWPLHETYGSKLNNVSGKQGMRFDFRDGRFFVLRTSPSVLKKIANILTEQGVSVVE